MEKVVHNKNFEKWNGLSDMYHNSRPIPPETITQIILSWLKREPDTVVDVGCGTGLSTIIWNDIAKSIIGIEPNDDMRTTAEKNANANSIVFKKGVSNDTNLPSSYADIITVSQAFHWMDIDSTLFEFYRILKEGGILAVYDCVWPPIMDWEIEKAYRELMTKCANISYSQENPPVHNDRNSYVDRINNFGKFRYAREVACHSVETCTPQRVMEFTLTQGSTSDALKINNEIKKDVDDFFSLVRTRCNDKFEIIFPYKIVITVK